MFITQIVIMIVVIYILNLMTWQKLNSMQREQRMANTQLKLELQEISDDLDTAVAKLGEISGDIVQLQSKIEELEASNSDSELNELIAAIKTKAQEIADKTTETAELVTEPVDESGV